MYHASEISVCATECRLYRNENNAPAIAGKLVGEQ